MCLLSLMRAKPVTYACPVGISPYCFRLTSVGTKKYWD